MTTCESEHLRRDGPEQPKLILLGGENGKALLKLPVVNGPTVTAELNGRHVRVLLVLDDALGADEDVAEGVRGWLNDEFIAEAYIRGDPFMFPPTPAAIAAYRAQINNRIREATPPGYDPPKLVLSERCVGVRLVQELDIVDLSQRRKSRLRGEG